MRTIEYNRTSLVLSSLFTLFICPIMGVFMCMGGGVLLLFGLLLIVAGPLAALGTIRRLLGDATALRFDQRQVTVYTGLSATSVAWADVQAVHVMVRTQRLYFIIPVNRTYFLDFKVKGGLLGSKTLRLPLKLLGMKKEQGLALAEELEGVRLGAPNLAPMLERGLDARIETRSNGRDVLEGEEGGEFDADAVMASYLARRNEAQAAPPAAPAVPQPNPQQLRVAGFGRKGL